MNPLLRLLISTANTFWSRAQIGGKKNVRTVPSITACWLGTSASSGCVAKHWSRRAQHILAILGQVLCCQCLPPPPFIKTVSTVDSNPVPRDNKQAATGVVWSRQEKKERLSSTDRSAVFCFMAQIVVGFVVWLCISLEK